METKTSNFADWQQDAMGAFEPFLVDACRNSSRDAPAELREAIESALLSGGKRVRPSLALLGCEAAGGDFEAALPAAAAVEMIHAYSLIHDDIPCMDDDDIRRGQPTVHIEFGEWAAVLAGDALQAMAFRVLANQACTVTGCRQAAFLAEAAGPRGMVGGQFLDMNSRGSQASYRDVEKIHLGKTAALIGASIQMGVLAGGGNPDSWVQFSRSLGLLFQATDDILDVTAQRNEMGKPTGRDKEEGKVTLVASEGLDGAIEKATSLAEASTRFLEDAQPLRRTAVLEDFVNYILQRCR